MRILFVFPQIGCETSGSHAIGTLSAVLKASGHETALVEVRERSPEPVREALAASRFDFLAVTATSTQVPHLPTILSPVRDVDPKPKILLGGIHATLRPHILESNDLIDAVCMGEGEGPILDYVDYLGGNRGPGDVWSTRVRKWGLVHEPTERWWADEETLTGLQIEDRELFPKWKHVPKDVPLESVRLRPRVWIGRGCPFDCSYCCVPTLRKTFPVKGYVRYPDPHRVYAELRALTQRYTFHTYVIDDDTFTVSPSWLTRFALEYPSDLRHLRYEANSRVETITPAVLYALKVTGCTLLKFGLESGSESLRKTLHRSVSNTTMRQVFSMVQKMGIDTHTFNIMGFPGETSRQRLETVRMNWALKPSRVQLTTYYPLPGSELGDQCRRDGRVVGEGNTYFGRSILESGSLELRLYGILFRMLVYLRTNPRLAWSEAKGIWRKIRQRMGV